MNSRVFISCIIFAIGIISITIFLWMVFSPLIAVLGFVIVLLLCELSFRLAYRIKTGKKYIIQPKIPFKEIFVEPHPYLPYINKKNFPTPRTTVATYPLNREKMFTFGRYVTNNMGYINGPEGDRDIVIPKPKDLIRINCLGASTTGNYLDAGGKKFSYPLELERILKEKFPDKKIEVNNCGVGGRTSAEILIDFSLNLIDTQPDIVVIYHGYNDLVPSLTSGFKSDYSHAKRNLGEVWPYYKISAVFPDLPIALYNFFVKNLVGGDIRQTLLESISRGKIDINSDFQGTLTYKRNIEHIVNLCQSNGIAVFLSTFCHYMYGDVKSSKTHLKFHQGVMLENRAMEEIAEKHAIPLVDNNVLFPYEERFFVDSIHFSPEGMSLLAENISLPIIDYLKKNS
ncbi:MAG: SGNH/GDSL hydrolase family protein [Methanoregula sp.]|nr:SGNH/GDSL hydrolase family protein [Methanoregula sp.]